MYLNPDLTPELGIYNFNGVSPSAYLHKILCKSLSLLCPDHFSPPYKKNIILEKMSLDQKLCDNILAILRGEITEGKLYDELRALFPHTTYVCNSKGELVYYEGKYNPEKHKAAYERSRYWLPLKDGDVLKWRARKDRVPFFRLFDPKPMSSFPGVVRKSGNAIKKNHNKGGAPPLAKGQIVTYYGEEGIVLTPQEKIIQRKHLVGIGDPECQFKNFGDNNELRLLGPRVTEVRKKQWFARMQGKNVKLIASKVKRSDEFTEISNVQEMDQLLAQRSAEPEAPKKVLVADKKKSVPTDTPQANIVKGLIQRMCPNIVESPTTTLIIRVGTVLREKADIVEKNGKFHCTYAKKGKLICVTLPRYPTRAYFDELLNAPAPDHWNRAYLALLKKADEIKRTIKGTRKRRLAPRLVSAKNQDLFGKIVVDQRKVDDCCKNCKGTTFIDCATHDTCSKCGVTKRKIEQGKAYREMEDRDEDMNGVGRNKDSRFSNELMLTESRIAPGVVAAGVDQALMQRRCKKLNNSTKIMRNKRSDDQRSDNQAAQKDTQKLDALEVMREAIHKLQLSDVIAERGHNFFCLYRDAKQTVCRANVVMAACLYLGFDKPFVPTATKPKKRKSTAPYLEMRQKKLKFMDLKQTFNPPKRKHSRLSKSRH